MNSIKFKAKCIEKLEGYENLYGKYHTSLGMKQFSFDGIVNNLFLAIAVGYNDKWIEVDPNTLEIITEKLHWE